MHLVIFAAALLVSVAFTRLVRDVSIARGWVSIRSSDRHVHTRPIPRLGGVVIFLTLWCMVLLAYWLPGHFGTREFLLPHFTLKILGPATIIFLLGLIDDFCAVSAYVKFAVQAGGAAVFFFYCLWISPFSILSGYPPLGWVVRLSPSNFFGFLVHNAFYFIYWFFGFVGRVAAV